MQRKTATAGLLAAALLLSACATPQCGPLEGRPSHHGIGGFCNPPGSPKPTAGAPAMALDLLRIATARHRGPVPAEYFADPAETLKALHEPSDKDRITWLGHATVLVEMEGRRVLVDPVWSTYVTPLPPFGPRRVAPPPVPLEKLPEIDVILVTHNHYDHLDRPALERMPGKERIEVVAPLGVGDKLRSMGFANVTETDWWEAREIAGLTLWTLPAVHESGRTPFAKDDTLWASFALVGPGEAGSRVYVSGDSGYHSHYGEIGERLGPFDLAVMSLGGYAPVEVASAYHFTPEQSIRALADLNARSGVPVHWATYPLGSEGTFEPGPAFLDAAEAAGSPPGHASLMRVGETRPIRVEGASAPRPARESSPSS